MASGALALGACGRGESPPLRGARFPTFELPDLAGSVRRTSDYIGRPLLLNFWATWCPPCRSEMHDLEAMAAALVPRGLQCVAVSVDDDRLLVVEYLRRESLKLDVLLDAGHRWCDSELRLPGFPTTVLLGADGRVRDVWVGPRPWSSPTIQHELVRDAGLS